MRVLQIDPQKIDAGSNDFDHGGIDQTYARAETYLPSIQLASKTLNGIEHIVHPVYARRVRCCRMAESTITATSNTSPVTANVQ